MLAFFNTTYHDFLRCIVNIYGFQIRATRSYHSPHFTTTFSPTTLTTFPPFRPSPIPHTHPSHPPGTTPHHGNITVSDICWRIWGSNLGRSNRTNYSPKHSDKLRYPSCLQINEIQSFSLAVMRPVQAVCPLTST